MKPVFEFEVLNGVFALCLNVAISKEDAILMFGLFKYTIVIGLDWRGLQND